MSNEAERAVDSSGSDDLADILPERWRPTLQLPCGIEVELPIHDYRVGNAVQLAEGRILDTQWKVGRDLPLFVNRQLVAWVEFEVLAGKLAVRVTELADDLPDSRAALVRESEENQHHE